MEPQETQEHSQKARTLTIIVVVALILGIGYVLYMNSRTEKVPDSSTPIVGVDYTILGVKYDDLGPYFVQAESLQVLYTTTTDCTGKCLEEWIPYEATGSVALGNLFTEEREDNSALQYTWKGEKLYMYTKDTWDNPIGDGVGGLWNIARS